MFIKKFTYADQDVNWILDPVTFGEITLLLGVSGTGKSRILKGIMKVKNILNGNISSMGGVKWDVEFTNECKNFRWMGEFSSLNMPFLKLEQEQNSISGALARAKKIKPRLIFERLECEGECILEKKDDKTFFKGALVPELSDTRSLIQLYEVQPECKAVQKAFSQVLNIDFSADINFLLPQGIYDIFEKDGSRIAKESVIFSELPVITKLAYLYVCEKEIFERVKNAFLEMFPYVKDMRFKTDESGCYYVLEIIEQHTGWISQTNFSRGMFKTLMFIAQINMLGGESVLLIDEIENSLGLNCIDVLSEEFAKGESRDQFILTTHHPYIINNISMDHWLIISREGGNVRGRTAGELHLGESAHDAFFQLINLNEYNEGIM